MRILYSLILYLSVPLVLLKLLLRGIGNPGYLERIPERFGFMSKPTSELPVIWVHAVSVGEVRTSGALVNRLLRTFPRYQVLMTTITPTGAEQVRQLFAGEVAHRYLPYDLPCGVRTFLRTVNPRLLIIMETEIWPNLLHYCKRNGVPALLVNARLSVESYRGYLRFRRFSANTLQTLSHIAAQGEEDAGRFLALGARPGDVSVTGNLKFDVEIPDNVTAQAGALRRFFSADRPVWIAASTHEGEEKLVLEAFQRVRETLADCLLIIAPRHPERFDNVYNLCRRRGFVVVKRTDEGLYDQRNTDVYLVDTMGELPLFYGSADAAFVGGSLVPAGGHNVLEAARLGIAVISGKHTFNFREIISLFKDGDALIIVSDPAALAASVVRLLLDADLRRGYGERGKRMTARNQGAIDSVMALLDKFLGTGF